MKNFKNHKAILFLLANFLVLFGIIFETQAQNLCCPTTTAMSGLYIIDSRISPATDCYTFTTLSDAATALNQRGVSGPVTLVVAHGSGPYTHASGSKDVFKLSSVNTTTTNSITIYGNGTRVHTSNDSGHNAFHIDNTPHVTIADFTIEGNYGVRLSGALANIKVINNKLTLGTHGIRGESITSAGTGLPGFYIAGNTIDYGTGTTHSATGIVITSTSNQGMSIIVERNDLKTNDYGINTSNFAVQKIIGNSVYLKARFGNSRSYGITVGSSTVANVIVEGNKVLNFRTVGIYSASVNGTSTARNLIANNVLRGFQAVNLDDECPIPAPNTDCMTTYDIYNQHSSALGNKGLYLNGTKYMDVYHNSIETYCPAGFAFLIGGGSNHNNIANNSFSYKGGSDLGVGFAMRLEGSTTGTIPSTSSNTFSNNNFYSNGTISGFQETACTNPCTSNSGYFLDVANSDLNATSLISTAIVAPNGNCSGYKITSYSTEADFRANYVGPNTISSGMQADPGHVAPNLHINSSSTIESSNLTITPASVLPSDFNVDVDGQVRGASVDIGADELCGGQQMRLGNDETRTSNSSYNVSPIPFGGSFIIKAEFNNPQGSDLEIRLYDVIGKIVLEERLILKDGEAEVKVPSNMPRGTYILEVISSDSKSTQTVVKM